MAWFWYCHVGKEVFEGVLWDGSLEDFVADMYYWSRMGICPPDFNVGYES